MLLAVIVAPAAGEVIFVAVRDVFGLAKVVLTLLRCS